MKGAEEVAVPAPESRPRLNAAVRLAILIGALAVSFGLGLGSEPGSVHVLPQSASGAVHINGSRGTGAILSASGLMPGHSVAGAVTITNSGEGAAAVTLSQADLTDSPGAGGARLSAALVMAVEDATTGRRVYSGDLSSMPALPLGTFRTGEAREFRFTASLPAGLSSDLMRTSASVRYDWTATAVDESVAPPVAGGDPVVVPDPPAAGATPVPTPQPPAGAAPLALTVQGKASQKWSGPIVVNATCTAACALGTSAKLTGVKKPPKLKVPAARGGANTPVTIKVNLPASAKAALKKLMRNKRAPASVTVTVVASAGGQTAQRVVTVKLAAR